MRNFIYDGLGWKSRCLRNIFALCLKPLAPLVICVLHCHFPHVWSKAFALIFWRVLLFAFSMVKDKWSDMTFIISYATCSAYSAVLLHESEKMSQQKKKISISSKWIWIIWNFFLKRTTALLALLPNFHDAIACISSVYKFKRMDANKIKMIDLIEICHLPVRLSL